MMVHWPYVSKKWDLPPAEFAEGLLRNPKMLLRFAMASDYHPWCWDVIRVVVFWLKHPPDDPYLKEDVAVLAKDTAMVGILFDWAVDAFVGISPQPKKRRGGDVLKHFRRNNWIYEAVERIGKPYTSPDGKQCACRLVAERIGMSYEEVRTVWRNVKKTRNTEMVFELPPDTSSKRAIQISSKRGIQIQG